MAYTCTPYPMLQNPISCGMIPVAIDPVGQPTHIIITQEIPRVALSYPQKYVHYSIDPTYKSSPSLLGIPPINTLYKIKDYSEHKK
jgi:hypothetical protein